MNGDTGNPITTIANDSRGGFGDDRARAVREASALIVAQTQAALRTAEDAIDCVHARVLARLNWTDPEALGEQTLVDLIMVEAEGVAPGRIEAILPRIDTLARAIDAKVIVALDTDQIDLVTAIIFGEHVSFLCAPTLSQRVAALALAKPGGGTRLRERSRGVETDRLLRLNEEVARIAETLTRLTRGEAEPSPAESVGDRRPSYGAGPTEPGAAVSAREIRLAIKSRRLRDQFFERGLFEDPAWDMLLDLFAAELEDVAVSVSSLCIAAAVAPTTALRWIAKLTDAGLLERRPDPFDKRRAFMALSEKARAGLTAYCAAIRQAGLAIV